MAEIEKNERQIQQQQERDDEMREMALRLRRRLIKLNFLRKEINLNCNSKFSILDSGNCVTNMAGRVTKVVGGMNRLQVIVVRCHEVHEIAQN